MKEFFAFLAGAVGYFITLFKFPSGEVKPIKIYDEPHTVSKPVWQQTGNYTVWLYRAGKLDDTYFSGWFKRNNYLPLVAAMCMVESSGGLQISRAVSAKDTSYGVMQVTPYTAGDIYKWGGTVFGQPTVDKLKYMPSSLYFGMTYVKILNERFGMKTYEEVSRAYNGGPGWKKAGQTSLNNTANHWAKIQRVLAENAYYV